MKNMGIVNNPTIVISSPGKTEKYFNKQNHKYMSTKFRSKKLSN